MHRATPALLRATRYAPRASRRQASSALFSGGFELPVVTQLKDTMRAPSDYAKWPVFRMIDLEGKRLPGTPEPSANLDEATCRKMMETMIRLNQMDTVLYAAQRQGRITFYCTHFGEEAASVASAAAYDDNDMIMSQYREAGALMYRGHPLHKFVDQCRSNVDCNTKGRQMPVHYGSAALNFVTISTPLSTQVPQAAGIGLAYKLAKQDNVCVCYFAEGAASEGDFHAGLNFASVLDVPVLFIVRNNGWAISTPSVEGFGGDGIVPRCQGYGMAGARVDGNDALAIFNAVEEGRKYCIETGSPMMIELMTYRIGHHTTSDDSLRYRTQEEIDREALNDPLKRLALWMEGEGWWSKEEDAACRDAARKEVSEAMNAAELKPGPALSTMFEDVYGGELPWHLERQRQQLHEHLSMHGKAYETEFTKQ